MFPMNDELKFRTVIETNDYFARSSPSPVLLSSRKLPPSGRKYYLKIFSLKLIFLSSDTSAVSRLSRQEKRVQIKVNKISSSRV